MARIDEWLTHFNSIEFLQRWSTWGNDEIKWLYWSYLISNHINLNDSGEKASPLAVEKLFYICVYIFHVRGHTHPHTYCRHLKPYVFMYPLVVTFYLAYHGCKISSKMIGKYRYLIYNISNLDKVVYLDIMILRLMKISGYSHMNYIFIAALL